MLALPNLDYQEMRQGSEKKTCFHLSHRERAAGSIGLWRSYTGTTEDGMQRRKKAAGKSQRLFTFRSYQRP